jgi:hypothetical protein
MKLTDDELLKQFRRDFKAAKHHWKDWRQEARDLYEFVAGRQWDPEDLALMEDQRRPAVTFNVADKFIDAVAGLQINNRQEIRYFPREVGDAAVNELATGAAEWTRDLSDAEAEESEAFYDMILTGMGFMEHRLDDEGADGEHIAQCRVDPMECYPDHQARKRNLLDARYFIRLKPYSPEEYAELYEVDETEAQAIADADAEHSEDHGIEIVHEPEDYEEDSIANQPGAKRKVRVAHYQYVRRESRVQVKAMIPNPQTLQSEPFDQELEPETWAKLEAALKANSIPYQATKTKRRVYYTAIICGDKVHAHDRSPAQAGMMIQTITGKRDRNTGTWRGIGRNIKDPNLWGNKFFSSILWQLSVNPKGGLLAERGAFDDPRKAEESWADPSKITFLEDGALSEGKVKEKPAGQYPQGMDRLMAFSLEALPAVSGLNLELMGLADRQQAGVLEAQRKQSAMAIIAWAFDSMRRYYRTSGKLLLELIREFMSDERIIRITGDDGAKYIPLLRDKLAGTFDVIVDEAPTSTNMRERTWAVLREVIPIAQAAQAPIPKKILDYMPIPTELSNAWKEELKPNPEVQEMQKRMAELEAAIKEAGIMKDRSTAELNQAKAQHITQNAPFVALKTAAEAGAAQAGD